MALQTSPRLAPYSPSYDRPTATTDGQPSTSARWAACRLAAYTALILFFELAFIRYTAGVVRVFGFYLNFVLIAAFLGMGVGLLRAASARRLRWLVLPATVALLVAITYLGAGNIAVPTTESEHLWSVFLDAGNGRSVPLLWAVLVLFALLTAFFIPLGALVGAEFRKLPALTAYSVDIVGSLLGIALFAALSAARQPPPVWLTVGFAIWAIAAIADLRYAAGVVVAGSLALVVDAQRDSAHEYWSPYYRIGVERGALGTNLTVNGAFHQVMLRSDAATLAASGNARTVHRGYRLPYALAPRIDTALVVGAGTGNDVAVLLERGAAHIDAVEIDPVIMDLGRAIHPHRPYDDRRVRAHVDDARAFLRRVGQQYDVIVFGTLDSQTLLSGMSSVRLDNYVYTVESFRAVRERLKPGGVLILYHSSAFPHISAKIYQMLGEAFGTRPHVMHGQYILFNNVFVTGTTSVGGEPAPAPSQLAASVTTPTDDWPYLYLQAPSVPSHYALALAAVLVIALAMLVGARGAVSVAGGIDGAMLFMGVGFLLIETKSVTEMSLLFGSTWTVNLLVFSAILVTVLVANVAVLRGRTPSLTVLFPSLLGSLAVAYAVPASALLAFDAPVRWLLAGLMVGLPILFAALIFSSLLKQRADASRALAYNLLGAVLGGLLEYASMIGGIKSLYLIAAAAYVAAWALSRRAGRAGLLSPAAAR